MQTSEIGQMNPFVKTLISPNAEIELRGTWLTWLVWGKTLGTKVQFSFPSIIILNPFYKGSSSRYLSGLVSPQLSQSKDSKEGVKCPRAGDVFCQSWALPDAEHLGLAYSLKWRQPMFAEEPSFPTPFTASSVQKVILLLKPVSLHFSTILFVFVFHLFSWFPVLSSCLKWLIFWLKLFFCAVGHNLESDTQLFYFQKLTYLSLKNIISPRKVVTASKVKLELQLFGSTGSFDSVGSFISVDSLWSLFVLGDGPKRSSLWKKL